MTDTCAACGGIDRVTGILRCACGVEVCSECRNRAHLWHTRQLLVDRIFLPDDVAVGDQYQIADAQRVPVTWEVIAVSDDDATLERRP